ncbi:MULTISPECIES: hypothetical protein [Cryobacterium]|uniref:HEPN AbiU2-like domain-containing protein n=1 Tax=Cryobacterium breve TaxID=1259258 RepID=A0ABY2J933_9MICO|nr:MULTISPECIES: hypothetical protein [Cryobacterium]TFC91330.1 hypothetical protein E3T20_13875 [Cryobacterium sp. TmT3-12]TFD01355.1 hypothetical protein E3O65_01530 [Cryobacterium breve]
MRISPFQSEYTDDAFPNLHGAPLTHSVLDSLEGSIPLRAKVDGSSRELLIEAVRSFYFAKQFHLEWERFHDQIPEEVRPTMPVLRTDLVRVAVIAVWKVFDTSSRTRSVDRTCLALSSALAGQEGDDAAAARDLVRNVHRRTNADLEESLKYVRHLRNKWAGHASIDRDFDSWAGADSTVSLAVIEKALETIVNAHQDLYEVIAMNEALARALETPPATAEDDDCVVKMDFDWSAVVPLAELVRIAAKRSATRLVERLALEAS